MALALGDLLQRAIQSRMPLLPDVGDAENEIV